MDQKGKIAAAAAVLFSSMVLEACAAQVAAANERDAVRRGAAERCCGVARAGAPDCRTHVHTCAGWSRKDRDPDAFVYVPPGTCERLAGGRLVE